MKILSVPAWKCESIFSESAGAVMRVIVIGKVIIMWEKK